jgi:uncharacterized membrane protein YbaN (DUF454 family)
MKAVYLLLGFLFFGLGAVGTVLPGLPTTVFMLLALWAFARSSERFHSWLYHHRLFGPPLQEWHNYRVIPLRAKVLAIVMMAGSLVYLVFFTQLFFWLKVVTAAVMFYGAWYILSKPSARPVAD